MKSIARNASTVRRYAAALGCSSVIRFEIASLCAAIGLSIVELIRPDRTVRSRYSASNGPCVARQSRTVGCLDEDQLRVGVLRRCLVSQRRATGPPGRLRARRGRTGRGQEAPPPAVSLRPGQPLLGPPPGRPE